MRVTLLLFASYRDLAGRDEFVLELPVGASAGRAVDALRERGGALAALPARPVVAVNQRYAALETSLADGDEVALLPPVAGG